MGIPTLYIPGSLQPLSNKIKKEELDEYVPMHYILEVIRHKTEKTEKNIHDHIFLLKSETGTGKSTAFIVETYRRFLSHDYKLFRGDALEQVKSFIKPIDFDFSTYDFPDDKYTIANRKEGFLPVIKRQEIIACDQDVGKGRRDHRVRRPFSLRSPENVPIMFMVFESGERL